MNIKRAKEEIEHTVKAYLAKDALGEYAIPAIRQRPILLMGPPGIGKTQIMEQAARECGVALVAYTITHHTRQSAVGLPFIRQRHYDGKDVSVTEYTMSEIIASVYARMEATGLKEGILFIDEINCVSETLAPTMLQFLQCKTFGNQAVPAGWVIVAAGNPPEYNKSVRDFDIVTLDRVRRMDIEPDLQVWKDYARAAHLHSAILSYLDLHPQNFYQINADVDGTQFVTARGWEDLSNLLDTYEALGLKADEALIRQYIQHEKIAEDFSAYLDLYYKYRDDYGVEEILAGQAKPAVFARLLNAPFDERLSLVSLLLSGLNNRFTASRRADAAADACYAFLREAKQGFATLPDDIPDGPATLFNQMMTDYDAETRRQREAGLLSRDALATRLKVYAVLRQWEAELRRAKAAGTQEAFDLLRTQFQSLSDERDAAQEAAASALEAAFDFMEQAFAESQEMVVFVTELTLAPAAHAFITENGCPRYFPVQQGPAARPPQGGIAAGTGGGRAPPRGNVSHAGKSDLQPEQHDAAVFSHAAGLPAPPQAVPHRRLRGHGQQVRLSCGAAGAAVPGPCHHGCPRQLRRPLCAVLRCGHHGKHSGHLGAGPALFEG